MHIASVHFDGHEHYGRNVSARRLLGRLQGLRSYCSVVSSDDAVHDGTGDHRREGCQPYDDCQLLQLTDLLVGAFRIAALGRRDCRPSQWRLADPARRLIEEYRKGPARMRKSRWRDSFCMSECSIEGGGWCFSTIEYAADDGSRQAALELD
jgi:hypothetical protein